MVMMYDGVVEPMMMKPLVMVVGDGASLHDDGCLIMALEP